MRRTAILVVSITLTTGSLRAQDVNVLVSSLAASTNNPVVGLGYIVRPAPHVDLNIIWNATTQTFTGGFRTADETPAVQFAGDKAVAYLPPTGRRTSTATYPFQGPSGSTYWIFPSSASSSNGAQTLYLGLSAYGVPNDGTFAPLAPSTTGRIIWTVHLVENLTTPSANAFYGYSVSSGVANVQLALDPAYPNREMVMLANGHSHLNLLFKAVGMYRITFRVRGTLVATGQEVSSLIPVYFGVETWQIPSGPAPATGYEAWKLASFSSTQAADLMVSGLDKDPDGDGAHNLLEYSLGGDPNVADHFHRPEIRSETFEGKEYLAIRFRRRAGDTSLTVLAESTSDPLSASWVEAVQVGSATPVGTDYEEVTYRATIAKADAAKQFMRVKVVKE